MRRRHLLQLGGGAILAPVVLTGCKDTMEPNPSSQTAVPAATRSLSNFGVQLSTVTQLMLEDFEGTLAKVAEIGYTQVEFSALGFLGRSPQRIQELLQLNGLQAPVGRISPALPEGFNALPRDEARAIFTERSNPMFLLDNVKHSLEGVALLGQKYLNLPALMPDHFQSLDQVKQNIELLNQAGELCAAAGVLFGYHNHNWELAPLEGVIPYDLMLAETTADRVGFQLDAYWIVKGGGDLYSYLADHPGRFPSCHLKDIDAEGNFADVGHGQIDFARFIPAAQDNGTHHFFVERDGPPEPEQSIRRSYRYLHQLSY